jgi:hypothetical protein
LIGQKYGKDFKKAKPLLNGKLWQINKYREAFFKKEK